MAQRVEYASIPNTPDKGYLLTINKVLGQVNRTPMAFRDFREWLRDQQLWDKTTTGLALLHLGVQLKPEVGLTALGVRLLEIDDELVQKSTLFRAFRDENTLLMKFVLEALDPDSGGRLHSTYELHRMLSSYVYPGTPVTLPNFQNWIKWMAACDAIRLIGIRWGLGEVGNEHIEWFRARDADEILEDEAEEAAEGAPSDNPIVVRAAGGQGAISGDAAAPSAPASAPVAAAPAPSVDPPVSSAGSEEPEDLPDMPPEAEPPSEQVVDDYLARLQPESTEPPPPKSPHDAAQAAARAARSMPSPAPSYPAGAADGRGVVPPVSAAPMPGLPHFVEAPLRSDALARTEVWLGPWWTRAGDEELGWADLGLEAGSFESQPAAWWTRLGYAGVILTSAERSLGEAWLRRVQGAGVFEGLESGSLQWSDALSQVGYATGDRTAVRMAETLVHAVWIAERAKALTATGALDLKSAQSGHGLVGRVTTDLVGPAWPLAAHWVVRELVRAGHLDPKSF